MSCEAIAKVLFVDGDTIRDWHRRYQEDGVKGLTIFDHEGGVCRLPAAEWERLKAWIGETLPCSTREIGGRIARECAALTTTRGRSGLVALAASAGHRISQADGDLTQVGSGEAGGVHQDV